MAVIAGYDDNFVRGFDLKSETLVPILSRKAHTSAVKCVAVSRNAFFSCGCGEDKSIRRYRRGSNVFKDDSCINQTGAINCVCLSDSPDSDPYDSLSVSAPHNLLGGSEKGTVSIYGVNPFVCKSSIQAHTKYVNDLSIDPSGNLVLSVGGDSCLSVINLVKGEMIFCRELDKEATMVKFSSDGSQFYLFMEGKVCVYAAEGAKLISEVSYELEMANTRRKRKILCAAISPGGLIFTGGNDCNITAWDQTTGKGMFYINRAHSKRVKGIAHVSSSNNEHLIASASSDGVIKVWDIRMVGGEWRSPVVAQVDTQSRLTCLAAGSSIKSTDLKSWAK